jgi:6,7-dimethyl-8-ribityllumazine synthase
MTKQAFTEANQRAGDATIGIVASRFNSFIVDRLLDACLKTLRAAGLNDEDIIIVRVPGAFEIPIATQLLIESRNCDAVVTLGTVIRGETPHFEYIASECAHGVSQVALKHNVPVIFGVLTVDNVDQALDRAGSEESNKGAEAARAALEMINTLRKIKQ